MRNAQTLANEIKQKVADERAELLQVTPADPYIPGAPSETAEFKR